MEKVKNNRYITISLPPGLRSALQEAANSETRSLSAQASHFIKEGLIRSGLSQSMSTEAIQK